MADQLQQWLFSSDPLGDLDPSLHSPGGSDVLLDDIDGMLKCYGAVGTFCIVFTGNNPHSFYFILL